MTHQFSTSAEFFGSTPCESKENVGQTALFCNPNPQPASLRARELNR